MMALDTVDFPVLFWGAIRAGIIPVPLNTLLTAEQYRYILEDARAKVLFVSAPLAAVAQQATSGLDLTIVVVGDGPAGHPNFAALMKAERPAPRPNMRRRGGVLALLVRFDRIAEGRTARAFEPARNREALRPTAPRHHGKRRVLPRPASSITPMGSATA
jgi:acyl-CoA synthetase (AMP-forming)/AMP-acid ligase II